MEFEGRSNVWFTGGINHTWHSGYMRGDHWYYQRGTSSPPRPFFHIPKIQAAAVAEAYSARARDICCQVPPLRRVCWETWNARAVMRINTRVRILPYINYLLDWSLACHILITCWIGLWRTSPFLWKFRGCWTELLRILSLLSSPQSPL